MCVYIYNVRNYVYIIYISITTKTQVLITLSKKNGTVLLKIPSFIMENYVYIIYISITTKTQVLITLSKKNGTVLLKIPSFIMEK